jgi:EXLDI family protein
MSNKTIYVADADQEIFERAQQLAGENLSSVIVRALKEFLTRYESQAKGFKEITVKVGIEGLRSEKRFRGRLVLNWDARSADAKHYLIARVYRTPKENWAVELTTHPWSDSWNDWRSWFDWRSWMTANRTDYMSDTQLIVLESLQDAEMQLPPALVELILEAADRVESPVEYLDI